MKTLKIVLVLTLISLQAGATGFAHNMLEAQKMLKTKKVQASKSEITQMTLEVTTQKAVIRPASVPTTKSTDKEETTVRPERTATSFSQHVARWIVRVVSVSGTILAEKFFSLFSSANARELAVPSNARFLSITDNVVSYLLVPFRALF